MELTKETGDAVVNHLFELNNQIGLPTKLSYIGVKEKHIESLADLAYEDCCHPNNPKPVTRDNFKQLYTEAL